MHTHEAPEMVKIGQYNTAPSKADPKTQRRAADQWHADQLSWDQERSGETQLRVNQSASGNSMCSEPEIKHSYATPERADGDTDTETQTRTESPEERDWESSDEDSEMPTLVHAAGERAVLRADEERGLQNRSLS